jgi:hypothetical protein
MPGMPSLPLAALLAALLAAHTACVPVAPGTEIGAGALVSGAFVMPYVQVGRGSIYTAQGVGITHGLLNRATYWAPTLAAVADGGAGGGAGGGAVHFFIGGVVGVYEGTDPRAGRRQTEWYVTLGATAELRRRD